MSHSYTVFCEAGNDLDEAHQLNEISIGYFLEVENEARGVFVLGYGYTSIT